jgi:hypothetical protein
MFGCRHRPATWLTWFALTGCGLGLSVGCNPALTGNLGGNSIPSLNAPNGYVVILMMNQSTANVVANVQVNKNGSSKVWAMSAGPTDFLTLVLDCDITSIQFLDFGFGSAGGLTTVPGNLGVLTMGQSINCGNVLAVTAAGIPPAFTVQVY